MYSRMRSDASENGSQTVRAYPETGADFVSCGALTHPARAADLNFRLDLG
jgi:nicotinate-nucleotide pyrophosphorylase